MILICNHRIYGCNNKQNFTAEIVPHISSALRELNMGNILLLFSLALIKKCTVVIWHRHYYTFLNKLFGLGFIYTFFCDIIFSYSLTSIQNITFGYINGPQMFPLLEVSLILCLVSI